MATNVPGHNQQHLFAGQYPEERMHDGAQREIAAMFLGEATGRFARSIELFECVSERGEAAGGLCGFGSIGRHGTVDDRSQCPRFSSRIFGKRIARRRRDDAAKQPTFGQGEMFDAIEHRPAARVGPSHHVFFRNAGDSAMEIAAAVRQRGCDGSGIMACQFSSQRLRHLSGGRALRAPWRQGRRDRTASEETMRCPAASLFLQAHRRLPARLRVRHRDSRI
jgi:hypothetical protein